MQRVQGKGKILVLLSLVCLVFLSCSDGKEDERVLLGIDFPSYDALRAVVGNSDEVDLILPPGADLHSFEPTPGDMVKIASSPLVVYIGGESESWVDRVLESAGNTESLRLVDTVSLYDEELIDGMEGSVEEGEKDEHVWTSVPNYIKIVESVRDEVERIYPDRKEEFDRNAASYIEELTLLDGEIRDIVSSSRLKTLLFVSRFPFRYFAEEYGLDYYAPFPGCSHESEMSAKSAVRLIDLIREKGARYVLKTEMNESSSERVIKEETGADTLVLHSIHSISKDEAERGETYLSLMRKNLESLRRALS